MDLTEQYIKLRITSHKEDAVLATLETYQPPSGSNASGIRLSLQDLKTLCAKRRELVHDISAEYFMLKTRLKEKILLKIMSIKKLTFNDHKDLNDLMQFIFKDYQEKRKAEHAGRNITVSKPSSIYSFGIDKAIYEQGAVASIYSVADSRLLKVNNNDDSVVRNFCFNFENPRDYYPSYNANDQIANPELSNENFSSFFLTPASPKQEATSFKLAYKITHKAVYSHTQAHRQIFPIDGTKLLMAKIPGTPLSSLWREGTYKITVGQAVNISSNIIKYLREMHGIGFTHGDLHFGNILFKEPLNTGNVHFVDFGYTTHVTNPRRFISEVIVDHYFLMHNLIKDFFFSPLLVNPIPSGDEVLEFITNCFKHLKCKMETSLIELNSGRIRVARKFYSAEFYKDVSGYQNAIASLTDNHLERLSEIAKKIYIYLSLLNTSRIEVKAIINNAKFDQEQGIQWAKSVSEQLGTVAQDIVSSVSEVFNNFSMLSKVNTRLTTESLACMNIQASEITCALSNKNFTIVVRDGSNIHIYNESFVRASVFSALYNIKKIYSDMSGKVTWLTTSGDLYRSIEKPDCIMKWVKWEPIYEEKANRVVGFEFASSTHQYLLYDSYILYLRYSNHQVAGYESIPLPRILGFSKQSMNLKSFEYSRDCLTINIEVSGVRYVVKIIRENAALKFTIKKKGCKKSRIQYHSITNQILRKQA